MNLPTRVVCQKNFGGKRATGDEEDDRHGEVGYNFFLDMLVGWGDLDLAGNGNENAKGSKKPLILEKPDYWVDIHLHSRIFLTFGGIFRVLFL